MGIIFCIKSIAEKLVIEMGDMPVQNYQAMPAPSTRIFLLVFGNIEQIFFSCKPTSPMF